jgi:sensor histidine kinase YesM
VGIEANRLEEIRQSLQQDGENIGTLVEHIGLQNIHQRLKLYYGKSYGLAIDSPDGKGAVVSIRLPKEK